MARVAPTSAAIIARRRPHRSESHPVSVPPRIAPTIETPFSPARCVTPKFHWRFKKVGYKSCVPCDARFIVIMNIARYRNSFQCERISRRRLLHDSLRVLRQTSDSFTCQRTNSANSAGKPPIKNSSGPSSASLGILSGANSLGSTGSTTSSTGTTGGVLSGLSVQLAGSAIPNLDPVVFVSGQFQHTTTPESSTFYTGTTFLVTSYKNANFGVQQGFLTGTQVTLYMSNTVGLKQNSPNNDFNPTDQGSLNFSITQNLLNGFGVAVNNRSIRIARF